MDWKGLVGQVAPMLGTALGGPLGGLAVQAIGSALGLDSKTEDAVKQAIAGATPEQMIAIKQADNDFTIKMQQLGFEHVEALQKLNEQAAELDVKDRQGARDMQVSTKSYIAPAMSIFVTAGFFGMLGYLLTTSVPPTNKDILDVVLGSLGTAWVSIISFYFGSSAGSARKDELLHQSTPVKD